ncbi:hypothetical protein PMAYCL1PPCAC_31705, partial [Pristionchus mayeri]
QVRPCLICGVHTAHTHMGIDACRACAVFYRRCRTGTRPLKCKRGGGNCLLNDMTTLCRKCRFERIESTIQHAHGFARRPKMELIDDDFPMPDEPEEQFEERVPFFEEFEDIKDVKPSTSFIDHNRFFEMESASGASLLERIKRGYSIFCMARKLGESAMIPEQGSFSKETSFTRDTMNFIPATCTNTQQYGKVYLEALLDLAHCAFDDYRTMTNKEKKIFIRNCFTLVGQVTGAYRAMHHFPYDETVFISYTTTLNYKTAASFFDDSPSEKFKDDVIRTLRDNHIRKGNRLKKESFRRVNPTEDELMALIGLAFWNIELDVCCENLTRLATKNREIIMQELHQYYYSEGQTNYASRIGEIFCLLINIQKSASMLAEDIQLYRLLDVFHDCTFK